MNNMEKCARFAQCNCPACPIDPDMGLRVEYEEDELCIYRKRKNSELERGRKGAMSASILKYLPKKNIKWLSKRNQDRWHEVNNK